MALARLLHCNHLGLHHPNGPRRYQMLLLMSQQTRTGIGAVIRNSLGETYSGFAKKVPGKLSSESAEELANAFQVFIGPVTLVSHFPMLNLILLQLSISLTSGKLKNSEVDKLLLDSHSLSSYFREAVFCHVYSGANRVAKRLAKYGLTVR
ncbi:hypothetical protein TorRG33x02_064960 [Trema orientale]|uniref:RNase H type-1 domain-containing protein n=1 Tax=Trema orientale TaxID=63057 RepID=A0A2P5FII9_TREOI|nr:hypothetical protein TorRG33x02_064960 [Trema orientale]